MKTDDGIRFEAHAPERGRRSTTLMAHGCCCCCCCLHSIGGIAGAVWGGVRRNAPDPDTLTTQARVDEEEGLKAARRLTIRAYWLILTLIAFVSIAIGVVANPSESVIGAIIVALLLPAGQLLASIITLVFLAVKNPPRKDDSLRVLGRITLFAFLGGVIGVVGMVVVGLTGSLIR